MGHCSPRGTVINLKKTKQNKTKKGETGFDNETKLRTWSCIQVITMFIWENSVKESDPCRYGESVHVGISQG